MLTTNETTRWLTVSEAADHASVSRDTIYAACGRNALHHVRVGGRRNIRLKVEWIDAWLERHASGEQEARASDNFWTKFEGKEDEQ